MAAGASLWQIDVFFNSFWTTMKDYSREISFMALQLYMELTEYKHAFFERQAILSILNCCITQQSFYQNTDTM